MIEASYDGKVSRAICTCDHTGCPAALDFPCPLEKMTFIRGSQKVERAPSKPFANKRLVANGWRINRNQIFCPTHAKPPKPPVKEFKSMTTTTHMSIPAVDLSGVGKKTHDDVRKPTREQKRGIMEMLGACYDTKSSRYTGDETDMSVAKALGDGIMFGWVAEIREEFFGPIGSNAAIDELHADISAAIAKGMEIIEGLNIIKDEAGSLVDDLNRRAAKATTTIGDMKALRDRLDRITAKLGPKA